MNAMNATSLNDIINMFITGAEKFPVQECTVQSEDDPSIFDGTKPYLVVIFDRRFTDELTIKYMIPYICVDEDNNSTGFGWTCMNRNDFCDNIYRSVHGSCYNEYVVGFLPVDNAESISPDVLKRIEAND